MTAALFGARRTVFTGLRPVNPQRDMVAIADLLDTAFSGQLDQTGRRMLRDMRTTGRLGWIGSLWGRLFLPSAAYPEGFVWEQDGRVIGNASLLKVDRYPGRWVLANVAVHQDFRRRGIARRMLLACMDWVEDHGASTLILQVKSANHGALRLYADQGFETIAARTTWLRRPQRPPLPAPHRAEIRTRRDREWRLQWKLAADVHPEGLVWPYPLDPGLFAPPGWAGLFGFDSSRHWVWKEQGALRAALTARRGLSSAGWRFVLLAEPELRDQCEGVLLQHALAELKPSVRVTLDYPQGMAAEALRGLGFAPETDLTWMAFKFAGGKSDHGV